MKRELVVPFVPVKEEACVDEVDLAQAIIDGLVMNGIRPHRDCLDHVIRMNIDSDTGFESLDLESLGDNSKLCGHLISKFGDAPAFDVVNGAFSQVAAKMGVHSILTKPGVPKYKVDMVLAKDAENLWDMWRYACRLVNRSKGCGSKNANVSRLKAHLIDHRRQNPKSSPVKLAAVDYEPSSPIKRPKRAIEAAPILDVPDYPATASEDEAAAEAPATSEDVPDCMASAPDYPGGESSCDEGPSSNALESTLQAFHDAHPELSLLAATPRTRAPRKSRVEVSAKGFRMRESIQRGSKIIQILNRQGKAVVQVQGVRWRTPEAQSKAASILLQAAELSDNDNLHDLKLELHALKMAKEFETLAHS